MDRAAAIDILRSHEGELRRLGIRHAGLFGSTARGESGPDSDVDVLIEIDESTVRDVYDYVGVVQFIEDLFPRPVDVANRACLKDHVRPDALRDLIDAF
ncbi:nucleotidyltransferase domain-containing protein [Methylobacterium durans]|uniref:nucleotidyltransferase family protein n=1 Tax=Methylobacterium durans TaxID=2202825 RepID=UPI002AFEA2A4|nr:nucleotidyltransferase domain-containing protein [Methylobacterium durans]MEA1831304.1 nucleotidyltransferase domain-containing protein [Methylobacterium durans]